MCGGLPILGVTQFDHGNGLQYVGKSPVRHVALVRRAPITKGDLIAKPYDETE